VIDRLFLYFWLQSSTFQTALSSVSRSAQDGFNKGDLESIFFPLVDVERQHAAAAKAVAALAEIDRLTAEATAARRLLERLDQAILAKAFRGELVPQDPADEPASVLLARIKAARAAAPTGARRGRKAKAACAT
jgi:type I restriction enzyme S subunit